MDFIEQNKERRAQREAVYDPLTGEGCQGKRQRLYVEDLPLPEMYIPVEMTTTKVYTDLLKHKTIHKLFMSNSEEMSQEKLMAFWVRFCELRIKYDFEFFAFVYIRIRDKITSTDIPFKLNRGQRKLLHVLESMRTQQVPIRVILLKARQWGGSTLIQLYMFWIQLVHKKNWNSVICAHLKDASITIRNMFERAIKHLIPIQGVQHCIKNFQGTQNIKEVPARGCLITVSTAFEPDSIRSQDAKMAHFSEIAFYPDSEKKRTEDMITSVVGSIPREPLSMIVFESTANGVGDFFFNEWEKACKGETAYQPVFVPWFLTDAYETPFSEGYFNHSGKKVAGTIEDFIQTITKYELNLWKNNPDITLENLNWYRAKLAEMPGPEKMKQEYPSDDFEAWQDSGQPAFKAVDVERMRADCCQPLFVGSLIADSEAARAKLEPEKRKSVLGNVRFVNDEELQLLTDSKLRALRENNKLKIWQMPDTDLIVSNRYVVVYDPAKGISQKADWGVIAVFDRYWMMYGGVPEIVAEWRGHEDKDIAIWVACQIAVFYQNALLVVESNTFDSGERYDDTEFIFDTIASYYNNLYYRTPADKIIEGIPVKYGFHTNRSTKPMVVAHFVSILREQGYKEHNAEALNEARWYEQGVNGTFGAKEGKHDDILMTRMIGCYICYELPLPQLTSVKPAQNFKIISEACF